MCRRVFQLFLIIIFNPINFIYNLKFYPEDSIASPDREIHVTKLFEDHYGSGPKRLDGRVELEFGPWYYKLPLITWLTLISPA